MRDVLCTELLAICNTHGRLGWRNWWRDCGTESCLASLRLVVLWGALNATREGRIYPSQTDKFVCTKMRFCSCSVSASFTKSFLMPSCHVVTTWMIRYWCLNMAFPVLPILSQTCRIQRCFKLPPNNPLWRPSGKMMEILARQFQSPLKIGSIWTDVVSFGL